MEAAPVVIPVLELLSVEPPWCWRPMVVDKVRKAISLIMASSLRLLPQPLTCRPSIVMVDFKTLSYQLAQRQIKRYFCFEIRVRAACRNRPRHC